MDAPPRATTPPVVSAVTKAETYFDLAGCEHAALFAGVEHVWQALDRLDDYLTDLLRRVGVGEGGATARVDGTVMAGAYLDGPVYVAPGAVVEYGAMVIGPAWIGPGAHVRHGAYIRGRCLIGARAIVGHSSEVKGSILLEGAQAPHFNYVGDCILGKDVNLGAGTKLSNLKNDGSQVIITAATGESWPSGRRKLGAIIGDGVQTGCNCVTSPGTLIGPHTLVYPNAVLRGVVPGHSIVKLRQQLHVVERRGGSGR